MFNRSLAAAFFVLSAPALANTPPAQVAAPAPIAPPPVLASAPVVKPSREAAEIAAINERLAVMTARLAELEMKAKIAVKQSEISKVTSSSVDDSFVPSVREISGADGRIWAVLNVQGGNTQTVREGDRVGAWRVESIRADSVTVHKGREVLRLSFGVNTPQPPQLVPIQMPAGGLPPYPSAK